MDISVWLELASIFLSLVFEKNIANGKEACQDDRVQVCLLSYLSKNYLFLLGKTSRISASRFSSS